MDALVEPLDDDTLNYRRALGSRLSQVVDLMETKSAAAAAANVTTEQLNKWLRGAVKIPAEAVRAICLAADADFSSVIAGGKAPQVQQYGGPSSLVDLDQPGMIAIPRYDEVRPSAGPGAVAIDDTPNTRVAFEQRWLLDIGVQPGSAMILPAQGDSMEPTIRNGSPMLVDTSKTEIKNGYIYVIAVGDDLLVKRIRRRLDGRIELISDNSAYAPETLGPDALPHLRVIGRVYAAVSKF